MGTEYLIPNYKRLGRPPGHRADPKGGDTLYTYNEYNQLLTVSMPRSVTQQRTFNYDPTTHLLTSTVLPENGTTTYATARTG